MSVRHTVLSAAVLATLASIAGAQDAATSKPSVEELQKQIAALEARLNQVEATKVSSKDVDETVAQVIQDSHQRSQLLAADGVTAGWDNGFFIKSQGGNYLFKPAINWQFRNVTNFNEGAKDKGGDDVQNGFENRRLRFRFDGNVITTDLTYSFVFDVNRQGGGVALLDSWAHYKFADELGVRVGQWKQLYAHEHDVSGFNQLAVDRSLADALVGGGLVDRVQGVALTYGGKENALKAEAQFTDGANGRNNDFRDPPANPANFGVGGRVEFKFGGDWQNYKDFSAKGNKEDLLVLGGGIDVTDRTGSTPYLSTVDLTWENTNGWNAYGAVHANYTTFRGDGDSSRFDWGALGQVGYLVTSNVEVFGRYDFVNLDEDFVDENQFSELTIGANYFFGPNGQYGHRAKVTIDGVYLPDGAPSDITGIGAISGDESQFILRTQLTLQI